MKENVFAQKLWELLIKTSNKKKNLLYGFGLDMFLKNKMDPDFDYKKYLKIKIPYFQQYGFEYSMLESAFYSKASGVESPYYIPWGLWQYFICAYLNRDSWRWPYTDKNMFGRILGFEKVMEHVKVRMPETVIRMMNGVLFDSKDNQIDEEQAYNIIETYHGGLIFKPSVQTHQGQGVRRFRLGSCNDFKKLINRVGDFIIQEEVVQHSDMASFNPSSVNTVRICTYRDFKNRYKVLYATQRFGGNDSIFDNASSGGGFVGIGPDGTINRIVHRFHTLQTWRLPPTVPARIPSFNLIMEAVLYMHTRLPQFQIIAWDMAVDKDGVPVMIEYNLKQSTELCQMAHGPLFPKEDLDEIMRRISNYDISLSYKGTVSFPDHMGYTISR